MTDTTRIDNACAPARAPTIPYAQLPASVRCAVEVFEASGERTRERLLSLIQHYLAASALAGGEFEAVLTASAFAGARARCHLPADFTA